MLLTKENATLDTKITSGRNEKTKIEQLNRKLGNLVTSSNVQTVKMVDFNEYVSSFNEIVDKNRVRYR